MNYQGKSFQVHQKGTNKPDLCHGAVGKYKGEKDGLHHYEADLIITFVPGKEKPVKGEIAVSTDKFYLISELSPSNRMMDCSDQVTWVA